MAKITINGTVIEVPDGATVNISSDNGNVSFNGNQVFSVGGGSRNVNLKIEGAKVGSVKADGSVTCEDVGGNVDAGGSVHAGNVNGSVDAGGSVTCGTVGGSVDAGGSVKMSR